MTIETLRTTAHAERAVAPVSPMRRPGTTGPMCIVVNELAEGGGEALVTNLGRRGSTRVILLARRAARRDLVQLLAGGVRGGVTADPRRLLAAEARAKQALTAAPAATQPATASGSMPVTTPGSMPVTTPGTMPGTMSVSGPLTAPVTTPVVEPVAEPEPVVDVAPAVQLPELTARELGVLELVASGRTNRRIGEDLGLSALTVKSHLARISRKLGTGDRAELVAIVIRAGKIA